MLFDKKRLSFEVSNIDDYNNTILHEKEMRHMRTLFSSNILFDRFGDIFDKKNRQIKYVSKFNHLPIIENLDEVISEDICKVKIKES
jgi:hypothetical protein